MFSCLQKINSQMPGYYGKGKIKYLGSRMRKSVNLFKKSLSMCRQCVAITGCLCPPPIPRGPVLPREAVPGCASTRVCHTTRRVGAPVPAPAVRLPAGVVGAAASKAAGNID